MSPAGSIDINHLWKRFRADRGRRYLRDRIAEIRPKRRDPKEGWRWVLRDIDLHLEPGDSLGLIGANGSGKSTLLKILTGVMYPHSGSLDVVGRVGALLEVRAGLHGDLTGRENIFLYGALLGLNRAEITRRFDDIVDFSALADAIDRQVKFYSSGMQMRLGFSVAAFLEPDVLLVDEALAVGDAFFQQRCLDRMRDLLKAGTTLVLVSHDLAAVESVCQRGVWLSDGQVRTDSDVRTALKHYRDWVEIAHHEWIVDSAAQAVYRPTDIAITACTVTTPGTDAPAASQGPASIAVELNSPMDATGTLCVGISEGTASPLFVESERVSLRAGANLVRCDVAFLPMPGGRFYVWVEYESDGGSADIPWQPASDFTITGPELPRAPTGVMRLAPIHIEAEWHVETD